MNDISLKLAIASMKREKRQYLISFIVMILSFTIVIAFYNTLYNDQIITQNVKEKLYGNWNICYEDLNATDLQIIKGLKDYERISDVELVGILDNHLQVANYQENFFLIAAIELQGNVPQNNNEIIVKEGLGKIGETIFLQIDDSTLPFKIVGTINDYDEKWCINAYDYFTYQLPSTHHQTYITANVNNYVFNDASIIYNLLLNDSVSVVETSYYIFDTISHTNFSRIERNEDENINTMNTILVFAVVGLLVGIGYTMSQRKERLLLLRSLGMSNKQVRKYIFYETICLALISLGISLVTGFVLSWLMSYIISLTTGHYYFSYHLLATARYIGILFLMMVVSSYFSYMMISIQSAGSLIHKKNRKKLKKYHKIKKMNIFNLAYKEVQHHLGLVLSIVILSLYLLVSINSFINYSYDNPYQYAYDINNDEEMSYSYSIQTSQKMTFDKNMVKDTVKETIYCQNFINEENLDNYYEGQSDFTNETYENFDVYLSEFQELFLACDQGYVGDFEILAGRMPENEQECLYIGYGSYEILDDETKKYNTIYDIGDVVSFMNREDYFHVKYTVVGIGYRQDNGFEDLYGFSNMSNSFLVFEDSVSQGSWIYEYTFKSYKDLTLYLSSQYSRFNLGKTYTNHIHSKAMIKELLYSVMLLITEIIFLILILKIFIERIIKDIQLMRCLGMTNQQTIKMILTICLYCFSNAVIIFSIFTLDTSFPITYFLILFGYLFVMINIVLLFTVYQLKKKFQFLPSDVQRYY